MSGYPEGKHDDPADSQDRLVRVGTKYLATAPSLTDGDNAYLLVDSAGRIIAVGPAASDAPELGNPIQIGGSVDNTSPASAAEGDVRRLRVTPEGYLLATPLGTTSMSDADSTPKLLQTETDADRAGAVGITLLAPDSGYNTLRSLGDTAPGLGVMAVGPRSPGASEIKTAQSAPSPSNTRATLVTPTSGKKARIVYITLFSASATGDSFQVYFATGAGIGTTAGKEIAWVYLDVTDLPSITIVFPDGGGPVGAVDDVISIRTSNSDLAGNGQFLVGYREE